MAMGHDMQHTNDIRTELTPTSISAASYVFMNNETIYIWVSNIRQKTSTIPSTVLVWKHPVQGFWKSFNWGKSVPDSEPASVWNRDNHWEETVQNTLFLDTTNTTANFDTVAEKIKGSPSSTKDYYSLMLYKGTNNVDTVTVNATTTIPANTSIDWYVSTDGGTTFQSITLGTTKSVTAGVSIILKATFGSTDASNYAEATDITVDYVLS